MKNRFLCMLLAMTGVFLPFQAGAQVTVENGTTLKELPGNATIVTGRSGQGGVLIYNNDESLLYRTLVAPRYRYGNNPVQNNASMSDVQSMCGQITRVSEKNRCIADVLKEREKLQKRYND